MKAADEHTIAVDDGDGDATQRRMAEALDTLPLLTRAVFLLHSVDALPYGQIAWRCGMTVDEVVIRMANALTGIRRHEDGAVSLMGRIRYEWVPWRNDWMRYRRERQDRALGISPRQRP